MWWRPNTLNIAVKRMRRFQHVVNVLAKHGFGETLTHIHIWEVANLERRVLRRDSKVPQHAGAKRLRLALEELGPTFIKLGQILSTRRDLVPPDIIDELKKLQASAHFIPTVSIRSIIESELGKPISDLFDSFDDTPLAAASLAQVHGAVLKGERVVLKVQRPNIVDTIALDIDILHSLARLAERYSPMFYRINFVGVVEEFAEQIKKELDFSTIHIPRVYPELCTRRVITMEYLEGISVSDTQKIIEKGYDPLLIAKRGAILGFKEIFEHGFFHADPHPGNIIILPDNVIGLVDYGMMATMSLRDRERFARLVYFLSVRDEKHIARALNALMESEDVIPAEELEPAISSIVQEYSDVSMGKMNLGAMLFEVINAIVKHGGRFRPQLIWVAKTMTLQEDIAHSLNADFNLMDLAKPYAEKLFTRKLNIFKQPWGMSNWLIDSMDTLSDFPYDIGVVMREIRKGRLKIEFEHLGLEPMRQTLSRAAHRASLAIIIAALLISSSLIVLANLPPLVGKIPLLALIGFILAGILGFMLAVSIWFRNR
ncbi:MAG: AarF/UbiB family protein [Chloroflexi bacterium]|nr:AarF/UbiB family protein [Chloroflexota bacterium]